MLSALNPTHTPHYVYLSGLCNADVLEATLSGVEENALARSAGVTRASVQSTCGPEPLCCAEQRAYGS